MSSSRIPAGERILLTVWVGGLWAIGYIAVPTLFANLDDRALAGTLAGAVFNVMAYVGLACGGLLLVFNQLRGGIGRLNWRAVILAVMLLLVAAGQFGLAPMIAGLRDAGLVDSPGFARLHGVAAGGYLLTSLLGLVLVISPSDPL